MTRSADGVLYVGSRREGRVYAIVDTDNNGHADQVTVIVDGLNMPNGVAYFNGDLYIAEIQRVVRIANVHPTDTGQPLQIVSDAFPDKRWHGWKFIRSGVGRPSS